MLLRAGRCPGRSGGQRPASLCVSCHRTAFERFPVLALTTSPHRPGRGRREGPLYPRGSAGAGAPLVPCWGFQRAIRIHLSAARRFGPAENESRRKPKCHLDFRGSGEDRRRAGERPAARGGAAHRTRRTPRATEAFLTTAGHVGCGDREAPVL